MTERAGGSVQAMYERDGLSLGYSVVGDGQTILFVHGATATGEFEWSQLAAGQVIEDFLAEVDLERAGTPWHGTSQLS
jgi:hypothetical protein